MAAPADNATFLGLSLELREQIYHYYFDIPDWKIQPCQSHRPSKRHRFENPLTEASDVANLLLTCHKIHQEAATVLFGQHVIVFTDVAFKMPGNQRLSPDPLSLKPPAFSLSLNGQRQSCNEQHTKLKQGCMSTNDWHICTIVSNNFVHQRPFHFNVNNCDLFEAMYWLNSINPISRACIAHVEIVLTGRKFTIFERNHQEPSGFADFLQALLVYVAHKIRLRTLTIRIEPRSFEETLHPTTPTLAQVVGSNTMPPNFDPTSRPKGFFFHDNVPDLSCKTQWHFAKSRPAFKASVILADLFTLRGRLWNVQSHMDNLQALNVIFGTADEIELSQDRASVQEQTAGAFEGLESSREAVTTGQNKQRKGEGLFKKRA